MDARQLCFVLLMATLTLGGCPDDNDPTDAGPGDGDVDAGDGDVNDAGDDADVDQDADADEPIEPEWPEIEAAELRAGAATATLDLPVGLPMAGYTGRCWFFDGEPVDERDAPYAHGFVPSTGLQTRIPANVVWLEAGDQRAIIVKLGLSYAFDGLVSAFEAAIGAATGVDVTDQVIYMTDHSHAAYGRYSQAHFLFLGHDRFSPEVFDRVVRQVTALAEQAQEQAEPAAIGLGVDPDFDPDDEIFRSRRSEHHGLVDAFGETIEPGYKDDSLYLLRVDASQGTADLTDDTPIAIMFGWGMHGTILDQDNPLLSSEAMGAVELELEERFEGPVTAFHFQVNGGDLSPAGVQDDFARMESIAEVAVPRILELWEATETGTDPIRLEAAARTIHQGLDIRVRRDGAVDWYYPEYVDGYEPDLETVGDDGVPLNPFDEFMAPYGASLCGEAVPEIPFVDIGVEALPYASCILLDQAGPLLFPTIFHTSQVYELEYPLWETRSTMIGALALDQIPVTVLGEESRTEQVLFGFFPGEATTMLGRAFQYGAAEDRGLGTVVPVAFSMDHEGYLLTVEDWLRGGYESSINVWGPLQGENILEATLELAELVSSSVAEDPSWPYFEDQEYPDWTYDETVVPVVSTSCGAAATTIPETLWTRDGWRPAGAQPPATVRRVADVAHFLWLGGDPAVDLPNVVLQRETSPGSGEFADVLLANGQPLTDRGVDMIVSFTPDPLAVEEEGDAQDFYWLVEWQAVLDDPSLDQMAGLPAGNYRFLVRGHCADAGDSEYPFEGLPYELTSDPFAITGEGLVDVTIVEQTADTLRLEAAYTAAARGFRLLHMESDFRTSTPIVGSASPLVTVEHWTSGGSPTLVESWTDIAATANGDVSEIEVSLSSPLPGSGQIRVVDAFGNVGSVEL